MNIFIAWNKKNNRLKTPENAAKITSYYQPFVKDKLDNYIYSSEKIGLIYISEKCLIDNTYFLQKSKDHICFSCGTPTGLNKLFSEHNIINNSENQLFKLKDLFDRYGFDLIKKINPPFIYGFIDENSLQIVSDGLGFEQCFIYEDDSCWICSNKCWPIVDLIGKKFTINDIGWGYLFEFNYFPNTHTPFKEISMIGKGEVYKCHNNEINITRIDCLKEWVKPLSGSKEDILEFSRNCFNESVKELVEKYCGKQVMSDLSGGKDTRMILSSFLNQNIKCIYNTIGEKYSTDIKCVEMIMQQYPLDVQQSNPTLRETSFDKVCIKINKFIQWQCGLGDFKACKYFDIKPSDRSLSPYFSGLAGALLKPRFSHKTLKRSRSKLNKITLALKKILWKSPKTLLLLKRIIRTKPKVLKIKNIPLRGEGKNYGLSECSIIDCNFIAGNFRRWDGSSAAVPFSGFLLPHLNIGLIKTVFSLPEEERLLRNINRYITESNSVGLDKIPYDTDSKDITLIKKPYDEDEFWRTETARELIETLLSKNNFLWANLLHKQEVINMWNDHCEGKAGYGELFWRIVGFSFWYEQFASYFIQGPENFTNVE
jgi:hypothetical protein